MFNEMVISTEQNLFAMLNKKDVVVPIIQRDYAQGRENDQVKDIRNNFINDILNSLENERKLKLSFVYGTEDEGQFVPYDGQQRLTLVYLLSLYLSKLAGRRCECLKKFVYKTRDYSTDFCSYLNNESYGFQKIDLQTLPVGSKDLVLKKEIEGDAAFFSAWKNDPTVESMLNVLQSVHDIFGSRYKDKDKSKLADDFLSLIEKGHVFFDWCSLNVGDSIYVKMNGRGKTLSAFDNFKNTLFSILDNLRQDLPKDSSKYKYLENFEYKMEDSWTHLFWDNRSAIGDDACRENIAPAMMNFFYFLFEYRYTAKSKHFFFGKDSFVRWMDEKKIVSFLSIFKDAFCPQEGSPVLNIDDIIWFSKLMDILCSRLESRKDQVSIVNEFNKTVYLDSELELFKKVCKKPEVGSFDFRSHFIAAWLYDYLAHVHFNEKYEFVEINSQYLTSWMQIVHNFLQTTKFFNDHMNDMVEDKHVYVSVSGFVNKLFEISPEGNVVEASKNICQNDIEEWLKNMVPHVISQFQEEILKLQMRASNPEWNEKISYAEKIPYFNGQIYFMIEASKNDVGVYEIEKFERICKAVKSLVSENGESLCDNSLLWRLLLCFGDYRISSNQSYANTKSLCVNKAQTTETYFLWRSFFDTIYSGRSEFTNKMINALLENDNDIVKSIAACSKNIDQNSWTSILVEYPEILTYVGPSGVVCERDEIVFVIHAQGVKKLVRNEHFDNEAINVNLYGIYRKLGFVDDGNLQLNQKNKWLLPNGYSIEQKNGSTFALYSNDGDILCEGTYETVLNDCKNKCSALQI